MTKDQLLALANSFPQKWCIDNNRLARCFVATLEGHDPVVIGIRYGRLFPTQVKTFDTKEEAKAALEKKRELRSKQEAEAFEVVGKYIRRVRLDFKKAAEKDKNLKDLLDAAADYVDSKRIDANEDRIAMMRDYIRTGTINMSGIAFRKDDVALVRYGQATISWSSSTTPIELTLRSGETVTTRTRNESSFIQDLFGGNKSERIWPSVKWPADSRINND